MRYKPVGQQTEPKPEMVRELCKTPFYNLDLIKLWVKSNQIIQIPLEVRIISGKNYTKTTVAIIGSLTFGGVFLKTAFAKISSDISDISDIADNVDNQQLKIPERNDLPVYRLDDVKKHGRNAQRIWLTYQGVCFAFNLINIVASRLSIICIFFWIRLLKIRD